MKHRIDFFKDEVRNGFYVPTVLKQAWAAELDVLEKIDEICKRHNLNYYADAGTLIGAIRHGGFIPWDDDIDIVLFREDFEEFLKFAELELPEEYAIHDYNRKESYNIYSVKIVNGNRINFDINYLNEHYNFPWLACVDVYALDYLYEDVQQEKKRDSELLLILAIIELIESEEGIGPKSSKLLDELEEKYKVEFSREGSKRNVINQVKDIFVQREKCVPKENSNTIGILHPYILSGKEGLSEECYREAVYVPFENTQIPVPVEYDKVLTNRYKDYKVCVKDNALHNYPFFETQKKDMEKLTKEKIFEFKIDEEQLLNRPVVDTSQMCESNKEPFNEKVLFLPIGIKEWENMKPYYEKAKKENSNISVVPLPLMKKDFYGNITSSDEEIMEMLDIEKYINDDSINENDIESFISYDIKKQCPDKVFIQNSYDNENLYLTVPNNYYVSYMRSYAYKIIYLPLGKVDDFEKDSIVDNYSLKQYLCKPGAVYADEIIVQSENLKENYIRKLSETFGEQYKKIWENKIVLAQSNIEKY